jgi:hypothetical protein
MHMFRVLAAGVVALATTGCLAVDSNIKVRPDGSGTIEQTMLVNASAMGMMSMMGGEGEAKGASPAEMFSETKLKAEAAKLGEGVTFVSSTPLTRGDMQGVTAIYSFTDFNALRITASPPDMGNESGTVKTSGSGNDIDMVLTRKGSSSLITLDMFADKDKPAPARDATADAGGDNPFGDMPKEMLGMLAPMFKDMRIAVTVEPVGQIVRTNATHVDGSKITILDIAFGELFADPSGFEKMEQLGNSPSMDQIRTALSGVKGIKVNEVEKLEIEFR